MQELNLRYPGITNSRIVIGSRLMESCGALLKEAACPEKAVIITDTNVGPIYEDKLAKNLAREGIASETITIPAGEYSKTLNTATDIYSSLATACADRGSAIIALGGGVIGDLTGFVASTYLRGLPLVHIPTSLLAQVDSSIGGKTAVNLGRLKNQVGTYYHACLVISEIATLSTLPAYEFSNGVAEIIKSAAIADGNLFALLEKSIDNLKPGNTELCENAVFQTARIKGQMVSADERDASSRQLLNFGHTIGHGIEYATGFSIPHGKAVAAGMAAAAKLSLKLRLLSKTDLLRLKQLIARAGLPVSIPGINPGDITDAITHDKKIKNGKMSFILITKPGSGLISQEVTPEMIKQVLVEEDD